MTLSSAGFPGSVSDIQWSQLIDLISYDGTDGMNVSVASGDRTVQIGAGWSNVGGVLAINDGPVTVGPLPANAGSQTRIDRIILRANWSSKTLTATYRAGSPSSNPQPPTLQRRPGDLYEVRLAQVIVAPGTGNLSTSDLLAERVPPVSGFYNSPSFRGFPDADVGALVWYGAANSLRVPIDGEYVEIAHARTDMRPKYSSSTADYTIVNTSPHPTAVALGTAAPRLGVNFVAPPSGMVQIHAGARVEQTQLGNQTLVGWQLRTGSTIGSGSIRVDTNADRAVLCGEAVITNAPARAGGAAPPYLATGLSPGSTYNVQTEHWVTGGTGRVWSRSVMVVPV